jgi:predicted transcriptional regulator
MTAPADIARTQAAAAMTDEDVAERLTELAAALQQRPPVRAEPSPKKMPPWMSDIAAGRVLTTNDAMAVCNVTTPEAVQSRCRRAEQDDRPIGICFAGYWLIDRELLLDDIALAGTPARLAAESRAKKLPKFCSDKIPRLKK